MLGSHTGAQWTRAFMFVIVLTIVTFSYQVYNMSFSEIIDYSNTMFLIKNYNDSDISEENIKDGYIVWSPVCRIPNITAYHESIKKIVSQKWVSIKCTGEENRALTEITYNEISGVSFITFVDSALKDYKIKKKNFECCYETIHRYHLNETRSKFDDNRYLFKPPICFKTSVPLAPDVEYLYVYCQTKKKRAIANKFYKNMHSVVTRKKPPFAANVSEPTATKYSVMIFGIDSISRLNLQRTMPLTKTYLEQYNWTWLEGYNKIADNTFPNVMAILSGMTVNQLTETCFNDTMKKFDQCPVIWKNFSQQGYLTAYVEDEPLIGTFNYHKYGFLNAPTDYYTRPYMVAATKILKIKVDGGMDYCVGMRPQAEYLFEYAINYAKRLQDEPSFSLFWFNSFSHNEVNMASVMDKRVRDVLKEMQPHLDSTIVFFLSDHGARFGPIRETFVGWLEERLPHIYIWIPPSFRKQYPEKYANLISNKNRLTSPFDVHSTLQEILYEEEVQPPTACPTCHSLFKKAAWNRSCDDAAIPSHWCTCSMMDDPPTLVTAPEVLNAAYSVLHTINKFLQDNENEIEKNWKCAVLTMAKVVSVRTRKGKEYVLVIKASPSNALFEATYGSDGSPLRAQDISRINMYGSQGDCVSGSSELKKFCYCLKN